MPGVLLAVRRVAEPARALHGRPREAALSLGATAVPWRDDGDPRGTDRDGDALRRGRRGRRGGGARAWPRHLIEHGSHGLVVAGTTGEAPTLDDEETSALLRAVVDEVGDEALLVCGTGTNDTRHSIELTKAAAEAGADAALVVTPYYNKPNPAGILAHFEAIAAAVPELPLIAYNIPSRVVVNMPPELLAELAQIDNVVAVKQANNDELRPIEGLAILAGNDDIFLRDARVRRRRRHPRRLAPRRPADARDVGRGPGRRHRPRARDRRRACARSTRRSR